MPLSRYGLWLAEMTTPGTDRCCDTNATAGVGTTPSESTVPPPSSMPRVMAPRIRAPDSRVSRPITNGAPVPSTVAAARPSASTKFEVSSASASPRTPSVPKRRCTGCGSKRGLALRVLRRLARLLQAVLAPFLLTCVAREQARLLERCAGVAIERNERASDAERRGAGLAGDPTADDRRIDVVDLFGLGEPQWLLCDHAVREHAEEAVEVAAVHR